MLSTSYANQPPYNGPGHYPIGASTHQPPPHQQYYGVPPSSQHQQPLAGPMPSGKQPEQFPGHAPAMMSGGGVPAMTGPPLNSGQMPPMNNTGKMFVHHIVFIYGHFYLK